jgi:hypothetical protein
MDIKKVDLLLKYILAAAGQEDYGNREVRPIHLISKASIIKYEPIRRQEMGRNGIEKRLGVAVVTLICCL